MPDADDVTVGHDGWLCDGQFIEGGSISTPAIFQPPLPAAQDDKGMFCAGEIIIDNDVIRGGTAQTGERQQGVSITYDNVGTINFAEGNELTIRSPL